MLIIDVERKLTEVVKRRLHKTDQDLTVLVDRLNESVQDDRKSEGLSSFPNLTEASAVTEAILRDIAAVCEKEHSLDIEMD